MQYCSASKINKSMKLQRAYKDGAATFKEM
jgi:hypothetical protein